MKNYFLIALLCTPLVVSASTLQPSQFETKHATADYASYVYDKLQGIPKIYRMLIAQRAAESFKQHYEMGLGNVDGSSRANYINQALLQICKEKSLDILDRQGVTEPRRSQIAQKNQEDLHTDLTMNYLPERDSLGEKMAPHFDHNLEQKTSNQIYR